MNFYVKKTCNLSQRYNADKTTGPYLISFSTNPFYNKLFSSS